MSTETVTPPAAPVAPAKPAGPVTPPIPAAQTASQPPVPPAAKPLPKPAATIEDSLRKVREEIFKGEGEGAVSPEAAATLTDNTPAATPPKKPDAVAATETKPAPVPADKDPFDHIAAPEGMTEKSLTGWKALKKEASEKVSAAEKKYNDALAQLETYKKATPADTAELARLKADLKDREDKLAVFDVKNSPDFVRQYVEPKKNALKEAAEIMGYQTEPKNVDLARLLEKPLKDFNAEVSDITKDMNGMDAQNVQASLRQAYKLANEEKSALSRSGELKAQIEAKQASAARQAFEDGKSEFTTRVPVMEIPANASDEKIAEVNAYNRAREEAMIEAEKFSFSKLTEREVAGIATRAASLNLVAHHVIPSLQRDLKQATELNRQMAEELAAIKKGKNPGQFTETGGAQTPPSQNRNAKTPDFGAVAREVGMR